MLFAFTHQQMLTISIKFSHASNMALIMSLRDKSRENYLVDQRRMYIDHRPRRSKNSDIFTRHNHASETDRRENSFAERADVDHTSVTIKSLQRREGTTGVTKLAVV